MHALDRVELVRLFCRGLGNALQLPKHEKVQHVCNGSGGEMLSRKDGYKKKWE